jgi:hypothetical protein
MNFNPSTQMKECVKRNAYLMERLYFAKKYACEAQRDILVFRNVEGTEVFGSITYQDITMLALGGWLSLKEFANK